ncbi:hypothetical protein G6F35_014110 [Rhizopus arrhizus]|nr:hypothetical protein G6F35_014110 [Rhizopus arrhizus]
MNAGAWACSWTRATRPNRSATCRWRWAMAWAPGCARRRARYSWTWPTGSVNATCACTFRWGLRFDGVAQNPAPNPGVVVAGPGDAGLAGQRIPVLARGFAERHAAAADHGCPAIERAGAGRERFALARRVGGQAGPGPGRHPDRHQRLAPGCALARLGRPPAACARRVGGVGARGLDLVARRGAQGRRRRPVHAAVTAGGHRRGSRGPGRFPAGSG